MAYTLPSMIRPSGSKRSTLTQGIDTDRPVAGKGPKAPVFVPAHTPSMVTVSSDAATMVAPQTESGQATAQDA